MTKATDPPKTTDVTGQTTSTAAPAGATDTAEAIHAQDARENGFLRNGNSKYSGNLYSYDMKVVNPDPKYVTNFTGFKDTVSADKSAYVVNNLRGVFDHDYHRAIPTNSGMRAPLIGIAHPGSEIRSGQNVGTMKLLSSNPYTLPEQATGSSNITNNQGYVLSQTYGGASQLPYDRWGEIRMSWAGLRNPWRLGGAQYNLHSSYTPPDKDQLTGKVPLAHPRDVLDVGNRPTAVVAPPQARRLVNVQNRQVRIGRTH